jgi:hypothetical protein
MIENLLAKSSKLVPENELAKEKLVQKTFIKGKPPRQLICDFHQMSDEIVKQQPIRSY